MGLSISDFGLRIAEEEFLLAEELDEGDMGDFSESFGEADDAVSELLGVFGFFVGGNGDVDAFGFAA